MRGWLVLVSALLHVAVAAVALRAASTQQRRRATSVAVTGEKKKPPKEEKPKPKPPKVASVTRQPSRSAAPSKPVAEPAPSRSTQAAPIESGLELGNDVGIDIGGPPRQGAELAPTAKTLSAKPAAKRPVATKQQREEEECSEAPSKPAPLSRPVEIAYTTQARSDGVEGRLVLRIYVGSNGAVERVEVVSGVEPALDAAAVAAVRTWSFRPALRCGRAMAGGVYTLARRFELGD